MDLATGAETLLGNAGALTGGGSFGIWTVLERGGYLYVQTTDNGIQVYPMNSATSLGALLVTFEKWTLDMVTGNTGQFYGLDVSPDGKRLVLGAAPGLVHELGSPIVAATMIGSELQLSWPASVTAVIVQSASSLTPDAFADMPMPPVVWVEGKYNKANVPATDPAGYYRLKRAF